MPMLKVYLHDKLLGGGDQSLTLAKVDAKERVHLAVVVVCDLATQCARLDGEADQILHIELVVIVLVILLKEEQLLANELLGTTLRVEVGKAYVGASTSSAFEVVFFYCYGELGDLHEERLRGGVPLLGQFVIERDGESSLTYVAKETTYTRYGNLVSHTYI